MTLLVSSLNYSCCNQYITVLTASCKVNRHTMILSFQWHSDIAFSEFPKRIHFIPKEGGGRHEASSSRWMVSQSPVLIVPFNRINSMLINWDITWLYVQTYCAFVYFISEFSIFLASRKYKIVIENKRVRQWIASQASTGNRCACYVSHPGVSETPLSRLQ